MTGQLPGSRSTWFEVRSLCSESPQRQSQSERLLKASDYFLKWLLKTTQGGS